MSGHADTIRYEQLAAICSIRSFSAAEAEETVNLLLDVPALLAENQRLRDELTATEKLSRCEHERRVEAVAESELLEVEYEYWRNRAHTAERSLRIVGARIEPVKPFRSGSQAGEAVTAATRRKPDVAANLRTWAEATVELESPDLERGHNGRARIDQRCLVDAAKDVLALLDRYEAMVPIIAALAIYGESASLSALVTKSRSLNEAEHGR